MGWASDKWKSIKKGFKSIGRKVKGAFKKFGKFMGKMGILGTVASSFILPGIGKFLMGGVGKMFGFQGIQNLSQLAGSLAGSKNMFAKTLGHTLGIGAQAVNLVTAPLKTVTSLATNFGKSAANGMSRFFGGQNIFKDHTFTTGFQEDWTKIMKGVKGEDFKTSKNNIQSAIDKGDIASVVDEDGTIVEKKDFDHTDPENFGRSLRKEYGEIPTTALEADTPITGELQKGEDPVTNYFDDVKKRIGEIPSNVVQEVVDTPRKMIMRSLLEDPPEMPEDDEPYVSPFPRISFSNAPFANLGTANQTTYDPYEFMYSAYQLQNQQALDHFDGIDYGIPSFNNFKSEELNAVLQQQSRNQGF